MDDNSNINYSSSSDYEIRNRFFELTTKATIAENSGQLMAAVNLYLAAYEISQQAQDDIKASALIGVKKA